MASSSSLILKRTREGHSPDQDGHQHDHDSSRNLKRTMEEHSPDEDEYDHDVFISFRGFDTRYGFTAHVHEALRRKQILAFIDSEDLRTGDEIAGSLLRAIQESKMYLVIFSPNYGSSSWCLMELEKILQYRREHGKTVIPVFYKVDPSHVRYQLGSFEEAFVKHEKRQEEHKVQSWRSALEEVASISGLHSNDYRSEIELIDRIAEVILKVLMDQTPSLTNSTLSLTNSKILVGINSHVEEVTSMLLMDSPQVRSVGIWGMGGIGKTTIAKVVFYYLQKQFSGSHFFEKVREEVKGSNESEFWSNVLSKILGDKDQHLTLTLYDPFVRKRLRRKKTFIVFDDVDKLVFLKLRDLAEHHDLFGAGSRILMTSRDKQVLHNFGVNGVYKAVGLKDSDSLKLLSLMAFKQESPPNAAYMELSKKVVKYTQGNPLALTVLGSSFFGRSEQYWRSALDKMEKFPKKEILDVLRISYDALSWEERNVFLDIACFLKGEEEELVRGLLECVYDCAGSILTNLVDKSFISISPNKWLRVGVHDLMQEMAWRIADEEFIESPRKRNRLHDVEDILQVLIEKKGMEAIHGIKLDASEATRKMSFEVDAFCQMVNLRWLIVEGWNYSKKMGMVNILGNDQVVLPRLRYLCWRGFPLKSFSFHAPNLVKLSLRNSNIERLWSGVQDVVNLRWMDLSGCCQLREIPDLSKAKNMESIHLSYCDSLIRVQPSVHYLYKLQVLNVFCCGNLREIPSRFESKDLRVFDLSGCIQIKECPEIFGNKLEELKISGTGIKEIPNSFGLFRCLSLKRLVVSQCGIEEVPSSLRYLDRLERLVMWDNHSLTHIPDLPLSLRTLRVVNCTSLKTVSSISTESKLRSLEFTKCNKLEDEARANIMGYTTFNLQMDKDIITVLAGSEIPDWFRHQSTGHSLTLQFPSDLHNSFKGIAFCAVLKFYPHALHPEMDEDSSINGNYFVVDMPSASERGYLTDYVVLWSHHLSSTDRNKVCEDIRRVLSHNYDSHISFCFRPIHRDFKVTKCGINLIF